MPNRYEELCPEEKSVFDKAINAAASGSIVEITLRNPYTGDVRSEHVMAAEWVDVVDRESPASRQITRDSLYAMQDRADRASDSGSVGDLFQITEELVDMVRAAIDPENV